MQKQIRNIVFYTSIIGGGGLFMYWVVSKGMLLENGRNIVAPEADGNAWQEFLYTIGHSFAEPLAILLAQIITIIIVARLFGWLFNKIGQPTVIGEIIAGIVLGPSLIGAYFPEFYNTLFPESSLNNLKILSNIGLILFMFVVGMELDLKVLRTKMHEAVVISHASIIFPFALGMGLAYFLYDSFAPVSIPFLSFALFLGISMSITAFPVLARIVQEKGINKTKLGTLILTCAAVDDITAWCVLAVVIAIVKAGSVASALYTILFAILYVLVMIKVVKPFLHSIGELHTTKEHLNKSVVAIFFLTLVISAFCTEIIGIHALFGAFMAGAIMPNNKAFRHIFVEKVEDVATVLLLPLFFVYTGLRTKIGLINEPELWMVAGWIILVAVVGKFVGSTLSARYVGRQTWRESLMVGALMNTRGLMELVVINIGYDLGVLTPEIFAMMVIMALITTFMTSPSLSVINRFFPEKRSIKALSRVRQKECFVRLLHWEMHITAS
jgi:Kef-type K+ transport systems, membrane components